MRRVCGRGPLVVTCAVAALLALAGCDADDPGVAVPTGAPAPAPTEAPTDAPTSGGPMDDGSSTPGTTDGQDGTAVPAELGPGALLTNADNGALVRLAPGEEVSLRLTPPLQDGDPDVADPEVLEVVPVQHFADPGYAEYELLALAPGRTTVTVPAADGTVLLVLVLVQGR
jgi:hypothetical protein